ncbi:dolichyl-P-Glc:Glc1Man(9)GlcNAc(2)-PP-dolichol alpha-1,3-glucosyltransferase [Lachancea thermotolerans CBS 6340]|uniref:Alpha-1,3-glucosyltransferase n=1 Tax=Lachancea thermotolerans (strain ATCC 56472 / CBS 6340 / NRRL Y-8284) TaxID=559295 RepID=C5DJM6_LACTC|nr:KLTH0F17666p [Lachancea thermotolerans CBS 6340]CAR24515.1 KLTH0F17666p [Lachancea thermotolerans CBS 6340]
MPKALKKRGKSETVKDTRKFSLWNFWVSSTALKLLLIPAYVSTDFDVHRNWLAITNKLPLHKWYYESTSQWTLDYPPFFAYFEWLLSQFVPQRVQDDGCLDIVAVGQFGLPTIVFQRVTVIVSEILLFVVLQVYINKSHISDRSANFVVASSIVLSPGFLIIDHIHFQYNGFLFAILIASIVAAKHQRYLLCGFFFSTALCFKHIFLYLAPSFFAFLLRVYILDFSNFRFRTYNDLISMVRWKNLFKLGTVVLSVFAVCFAPFIYQLPQLMSRLFPFSRGLTHAYWAPNFWALYSALDKVLTLFFLKVPYVHKFLTQVVSPPLIPVTIDEIKTKLQQYNVGTKGLVQDVYFVILPQIQPKLTFILTLFYQILAVIPVLFSPSFERFVGSLTLCGFASFLFGWHVHEKAVLLIIIPFSFLVTTDRRLLTPFHLVASAGYVSLFPLLHEPQEFLIKLLYTLVWCIIYFSALRQVTKISSSVQRRVFFFDRFALSYIVLLIPLVIGVEILESLKWRYALLQKFEFAGLMIYSIYCSIGILSSWMGLSWLYNFDEPIWK